MDAYQLKTWLSFLLLAVIIIVIFHMVSEISVFFEWVGRLFSIVAPFVWGIMIAYVLNIPREGLEKLLEKIRHPFVRKHKLGFSVLLTYLVFIVVIVILSSLVFPQIYASIIDFVNFLPTLFTTAEQFLIDLDQDDIIPFFDFGAVIDSLSLEDLLGVINVENVTSILNSIANLTGTVFQTALALISSVYFLLEAERIRTFAARVLRALTPRKFFKGFIKYGRDINVYFKRYIFCQVLDGVILGSIMTIVMSIMGVSYAFALGPMLGFANLIPYFGSIIGTIAAIIVIMLTDGMQMGLIAMVVMLIIQQIDANFIFPRLLGGSMKIPPILVIIGITVGGAYFGIPGMIIAIPVATVLRNIVEDMLGYIEEKKEINEEVPYEEKRK